MTIREISATREDLEMDWFGCGWAAFQGSSDPDDFPPLDDPQAQQAWLTGFVAAWAECPEGADHWCGEPVDVALMLALEGREVLWSQLREYADAPERMLH